jgi:hypothetical protein
MRAIVAILKDSFREAAASRVLWIALIAIVVVLVALAPLSLESSVSNRLRARELADAEEFLQSLHAGKGTEQNPAAHLWGLLSDSQKANVEEWLKAGDEGPNRGGRGIQSQVLNLINGLVQNPKFYEPERWTGVILDDDLKPADNSSVASRQRVNRNIRRLAAAFPQSIVVDDLEVIALHYGPIPTNVPIPVPPSLKYQLIDGAIIFVLSVFLGFFGIFASLLVTAGMIPKTFEPGEISLLLSKPVRRSVLFITKFFGGCVFTLICASLLVGGVWILLWIRFDLWRPELLLCIPLYVFLFAIYFSVSALAGAIWRNAIVSLALVVAFWIVLTTAGTVQGILGLYLTSQQISEITVTGDEVFVVDASRNVARWDAEGNDWSAILADDGRANFGQSMQRLMSTGTRPRVVANQDGSRIYSLEPNLGRSGGASAATLISGEKESQYQKVSEGATSEPVFGLFRARNGDVILAGTQSISRFAGLTDKEKQSREFLSRMFGGIIPASSSKAFEVLSPKFAPTIGGGAGAGFNHSDDSIVIWDKGKLTTWIRGEDGKYAAGASRDFSDKQSAVIASGGNLILCAKADGSIVVLNKSTLETIAEGSLPVGEKPKVAEFAQDGSWGVVMSHGGNVVLFGGESMAFVSWTPAEQGSVSAVSFAPNGELVLADGRRSVAWYRLSSSEPVRTLHGSTGLPYYAYDYFIEPLYWVLPKPSELDNAVRALVTGERTVVLGENNSEADETGSENLQQTRISFNLWASFWSNLGFVAVMLLAACIYLHRKDF